MFTIAIASGKGGTGKTTVAVNLATVLDQQVQLLDCDVEEPNCHIFIKPKIENTTQVTVLHPEVDETKCTSCGLCGEICQYNAIVSLKSKPLFFPELCNGCGGCERVCPEEAIKEIPQKVGTVSVGSFGENKRFVTGLLDVGQARATPVIDAVKSHLRADAVNIIDCPPGTSCPVIEAVRGTDFVLLVTEPTPFGLNDLKLAVDMLRELNIPFGVIVNRCDTGDREVWEYCMQEQIEILMEIPDDIKIARAYSTGKMITEVRPDYRGKFITLPIRIKFKLQAENQYI